MSDAATRTLASGLGFVEGPTLLRSGALIVVSLDHQRVYEIGADGEALAVASFDVAPNGATEGADGTVYLAGFCGAWPARDDCSGDGGVFAWRPGDDSRVITSAPHAPNDLCFGPDGLLYVTDPNRGATGGRIWTVDVDSGQATVLAEVDWYPNGIGFDADDVLWVADTHGRRLLRRVAGATFETVFSLTGGKPDGFAFDQDGHVLVAAPGTPEHPDASLQRWHTSGDLDQVVLLGGSTYFTNVAIADDGTMFVTEAQHGRVLALDGPSAGLPLYPFRSTRG